MRFLPFLLLCAAAFAQPAEPELPHLDPGLYARINTSVGTITAQLFEKETPYTVRNFIALARGTKPWLDPKTRKFVARPLYQNLIFHRVIPQFMIQTGDPTATGSHNCGFTIADEIVKGLNFDRAGRLGMANAGPGTAACQFFITVASYPAGNGHYTIFGQVVDGQRLADKIANVIRDDNDKPRVPTHLLNITFVRIAADPQAGR